MPLMFLDLLLTVFARIYQTSMALTTTRRILNIWAFKERLASLLYDNSVKTRVRATA